MGDMLAALSRGVTEKEVCKCNKVMLMYTSRTLVHLNLTRPHVARGNMVVALPCCSRQGGMQTSRTHLDLHITHEDSARVLVCVCGCVCMCVSVRVYVCTCV